MDILGIDIGGSGIKGAIVNTKTGELKTERHRIATPQPATPQVIADTVRKFAEHFSWSGVIGCGFPALVQNGKIMTASNIDKSNININIEKLFSQTTGCEVYVLNDADAAGIAEANFGGGKETEGLILLLTIGTGIGSALILDGKVVPNSEFGHLLLANGMIAEKYAADSARKRDKLKWDEWALRFDEYLSYIEQLTNPDLIILGGGAAKKFEKFSEYLNPKAPVKPAKLLNLAGIIGAAIYASQKRKKI